MKKTNPLKPEEVDVRIKGSFNFSKQYQDVENKGRLQIERTCMLCHSIFISIVSQIRADTKRGRTVTGYCSRCLRLPGEHQKYVEHRRKPNGWMDGNGYVMIHKPDHPFAQKSGHIAQHRLVMEEKIGRYLERDESVHHINGIRNDNRMENLELRSGQHGMGVKRVCLDCGSHNVVAVKLS